MFSSYGNGVASNNILPYSPPEPELYYFNDAAMNTELYEHFYKSDYPNSTNNEFIIMCKNRLLSNNHGIAFVMNYMDDDRTKIHYASFKTTIDTAYYKINYGKKIYVLKIHKDAVNKKLKADGMPSINGPILYTNTEPALGAAAPSESKHAIKVHDLNKDSCTDISPSDIVGWEMTPIQDITITDLGFMTDLTGILQNSHKIRIHEKGNETPLIEETISNDDTLENQTKYKPLINHVPLTKGTSYIILAHRDETNKDPVYTMLNENGKKEISFNKAINFVSNIAENYKKFKYTDKKYPSYGIAFFGPTFKFI